MRMPFVRTVRVVAGAIARSIARGVPARQGEARREHEGPPESPPAALRRVGSPGRTRTSDQSVTPDPAVSRGGGLSHHHGPRRPVGGGRSWGGYPSVTP